MVAMAGSNFSVTSNESGFAVVAPRLTATFVVNPDPDAAPPLPARIDAGAPGAGVAGAVGVAVGLAVGLGVADGEGLTWESRVRGPSPNRGGSRT